MELLRMSTRYLEIFEGESTLWERCFSVQDSAISVSIAKLCSLPLAFLC
jgi:hypothetical protein